MSSKSDKQNGRHIPNTMPDYEAFLAQLCQQSSQLSLTPDDHPDTSKPSFLSSPAYLKLRQQTKAWLLRNIDLVQGMVPPAAQSMPTSRAGKARSDNSIYVGSGGNAYLHWKLSNFFKAEGDKEKASFHSKCAITAIECALSMCPKRFSKGEEIAFYIGSAGIYALSAAIFWSSGHLSRIETQMRLLLDLLPSCLSKEAPDEILFGRAGYLFCLLFVQKHVSEELCDRMGVRAAQRQVFDTLIQTGKSNSRIQHPETGALQHYYHGTPYLGAAHGSTGILFILLQFPSWCREPATLPWITATLDSILATQLSSGNFPTQFGETRDKLVHWCHGAPGVVYTLYHAHKVLGQDKVILRSLDQALRTIWERGILRKGFGVCHGTAGSGYAFLMMYRYTEAEEHLYRAHKMAEAIRSEEIAQEVEVFFDPQRYTVGVPDYPYSLMEGLGGTICFCCDLLHPESAAFPGYEGDI